MGHDKNTANRAEQLQFLRFCVFFVIFSWHADKYVPYWFPHGDGAINAVVFFFILSGVVTGYSVYDKEVVFSVGATKQYFLKKIKKVYPLYFITTIFAVAYSGLPAYIANCDYQSAMTTFSQLVKNLLLLQSWFPSGYYAFNGVGWFLSTIMFLYLLSVPLSACMTGIGKKKNWRMTVFAGFLSCNDTVVGGSSKKRFTKLTGEPLFQWIWDTNDRGMVNKKRQKSKYFAKR